MCLFPCCRVQAELSFNIALRMADPSQVPALSDMFDEAIAADPSSANAYVNKAGFMFQVG